jgi:hypothetical protein
MFDLDKLYAGHKTHGDNPLCDGCTILEKSKPCHSIMDYEDLKEAPVLFLSDSLNYRLGTITPFSKAEIALIDECYKESYQLAASVKCPSVKEADMNPNNMNLCRVHLEATIDKVKPKLVFPCGNLAMKMLIKNKKVFHNAKFDLKFLINYGIYTKNVWDTKIMHHLLDENMPKGLMDLTKLYFANELENL